MDSLYALYPFLEDARAAVEDTDVDLADVVTREDSPIVERAIERVEGAIHTGQVPDPIPDVRVELLSYPVARVLVSLVDDEALTNKYALAEARRAFRLFEADREESTTFRSGREHRLTREQLLADFGLSDAVRERTDGVDVTVTAYLRLTSELRDRNWRLVSRALSEGRVPVRAGELDDLLREAIRERVADGLPLSVPEQVAGALESDVERIDTMLAELRVPHDIDTVVPAAFPPCFGALIDELRAGEELRAFDRFAAITFLRSIGLDTAELVAFLDPETSNEAQQLRYAADHLHGETRSTAYPPPSCAAMQAADVCVDDPDRCEDVGHALLAYVNTIEANPEAIDWRERPESA